jgi:Domain of unknown function (DUF4169)
MLSFCEMTEAGMGDLVNLKRFKKRAERQASAKQAEANRTRFGRTKSERVLDETRSDRAIHLLDQHRIDGEDKS